MINVSLIAISCGNPISNLSFAKQEFLSGSPPSDFIYQINADIKCNVGFKWTDGTLMNTILCQATGIWTSYPSCIGIWLENSELWKLLKLNNFKKDSVVDLPDIRRKY